MNEKLMELFKDNEFAEKAAACETVEEVLAMIKAEGVETTKEEFDSFMDYIAKTSSEHEGELNEGELEQVSGGGLLLQPLFPLWLLSLGPQNGIFMTSLTSVENKMLKQKTIGVKIRYVNRITRLFYKINLGTQACLKIGCLFL